MTWHKEIWTYLIVTLVAVLIWAWAASETRERKTIPSAKVQFVADRGAGEFAFNPADVTPSLNVEGTKLSVQRLTDLLRRPIRITVPVNAARLTIDLADQLRMHEDVMATGATIVSADPATVDLSLDQIERVTAAVKPVLPGVTPEGEIVIQPKQVSVSLPQSVRRNLREDLSVEAFVDRSVLDGLVPGEPTTLDASLRFPETLAVGPEARITPPKVKITFTIRSRIRETTVDSVRVQVLHASEDRAFDVEVDPKVLRGVTVLADSDLSRQIESGDVPVVAVVHLRSSEKEALIDRKPVSYFEAQIQDADGTWRYVQLGVKLGTPMSVINLRITNRATPPS